MPSKNRTHTILAGVALVVGSMAVLAAGADHLDEYIGDGFSTVSTIGTLFLLNFIASAIVGVALLLPLRRLSERLARPVRTLLALAGVGIGATSLIGLWISESSSLFGFTDSGFRSTIVVAIVAESIAILALTAYLTLDNPRLLHPRLRLRTH